MSGVSAKIALYKYSSFPSFPFMWYQNICSAPFRFVTIHACDRQTDGRTDGQNYDSQDHPRICSRGKIEENQSIVPRTKCFCVVVYFVLLGKPSYFYVVFSRFCVYTITV